MTGGDGEVSKSRPAHPTARHRHEQQLSRPLRRAYDRRQPQPSSIRARSRDMPHTRAIDALARRVNSRSEETVCPTRHLVHAGEMRFRKYCCNLLTTVSKETRYGGPKTSCRRWRSDIAVLRCRSFDGHRSSSGCGAIARNHGRTAGPFHGRGEALRRDAEPVHRRWHHGGVRRPNHAGGPRCSCLPGGLGHSGGGEAARRRGSRSQAASRPPPHRSRPAAPESRRSGQMTTETPISQGDKGITALFVRRPILAFVINTLIVVAGLAAFYGVEIRELPDVDRPVITVTTDYRRRRRRDHRPRADRRHRRRGGARLGRQVDLVELVLRAAAASRSSSTTASTSTSPPPTCATRSAASPTSCPTTPTRRASSRPTPMPTR